MFLLSIGISEKIVGSRQNYSASAQHNSSHNLRHNQIYQPYVEALSLKNKNTFESRCYLLLFLLRFQYVSCRCDFAHLFGAMLHASEPCFNFNTLSIISAIISVSKLFIDMCMNYCQSTRTIFYKYNNNFYGNTRTFIIIIIAIISIGLTNTNG